MLLGSGDHANPLAPNTHSVNIAAKRVEMSFTQLEIVPV